MVEGAPRTPLGRAALTRRGLALAAGTVAVGATTWALGGFDPATPDEPAMFEAPATLDAPPFRLTFTRAWTATTDPILGEGSTDFPRTPSETSRFFVIAGSATCAWDAWVELTPASSVRMHDQTVLDWGKPRDASEVSPVALRDNQQSTSLTWYPQPDVEVPLRWRFEQALSEPQPTAVTLAIRSHIWRELFMTTGWAWTDPFVSALVRIEVPPL